MTSHTRLDPATLGRRLRHPRPYRPARERESGGRSRRRSLRLLGGLGLVGLGLAAGPVQGATAAPDAPAPGPKTIVSITGDAADGFHVEHYDGSVRYTETDSEAAAECSGYDTTLARVRCRTGVRRYYADLRATEQALDYAHVQAGVG